MVNFVADVRAMVNGPFGETVRYWPYQGAPRDIPVLVNRNPPEVEFLEGSGVPGRRLIIAAIRSDVDGIADTNLGNDQIEVKVRKTDLNPTTFRVVRELSHDDDGMMRVEIQQ